MLIGFNPNVTMMDRKTLKRKITEEFKAFKKSLCDKFTTLIVFCLTADIWSSNRRSFMGVTGHWILVVDGQLKRKSAGLACRRFRGEKMCTIWVNDSPSNPLSLL